MMILFPSCGLDLLSSSPVLSSVFTYLVLQPKGAGVDLEGEDTGLGSSGHVCELGSISRCLKPPEDEMNVHHSPMV